MELPRLPRRVMASLAVGQKARFSRTLTEADAALFVGVTWDVNPLHTNDTYAAATHFGRRIVPGLLTASMATHLGGLWAYMALGMELEFLAPVYFGDTITAEAEVVEIDDRGRVRLACRWTNAEQHEVLRGHMWGYPGRVET